MHIFKVRQMSLAKIGLTIIVLLILFIAIVITIKNETRQKLEASFPTFVHIESINGNINNIQALNRLIPKLEVQTLVINDAVQTLSSAIKRQSIHSQHLCEINYKGISDARLFWSSRKADAKTKLAQLFTVIDKLRENHAAILNNRSNQNSSLIINAELIISRLPLEINHLEMAMANFDQVLENFSQTISMCTDIQSF